MKLLILASRLMALTASSAEAVAAPPQQAPPAQQHLGSHRLFILKRIFAWSFSLFLASCVYAVAPDYNFREAAKTLVFSLLFNDHQVSEMTSPPLQALLDHICEALWVLPPLLLIKVVSCFKFQEIADIVSSYIEDVPRLNMPTLNDMLAEARFRVIVPTVFLLQSHLLSMLAPCVLGSVLRALHLSMLFSLSLFDYTWFSYGWDPHRRVSFVEDNWTYFVGFGMPLVIIVSAPSSLFVRGMLLSILFPLCFLSSLVAKPVTGMLRYRLRLFTPAVWISGALSGLCRRSGR